MGAMLGQLDRAITLNDLKASSGGSPDRNGGDSKIKIEKFNFTRSSSSGKVGKELSKDEHSLLKQYRIKPKTAGNKTDAVPNTASNSRKKNNKEFSLASTTPASLSHFKSIDDNMSSTSLSTNSKGKIKKTPLKPGPNFVLPQLLTSFDNSFKGPATMSSKANVSAITMNLSDFQLGSPSPGAGSAVSGFNTVDEYSTASEFTFGSESSPKKKLSGPMENTGRKYRVGDGDLLAEQGSLNQDSFTSDA